MCKMCEACSVSIMPLFIGSAVEQGLYDRAEQYDAMIVLSGCCSYICPAKRPLTQWIRMAKSEIAAKRRAALNNR